MADLIHRDRVIPSLATAEPVSIEEWAALETSITGRLNEIHAEHRGGRFPDAIAEEWNQLNEERDNIREVLDELRAREERIAQLNAEPERREDGASFGTGRPGVARGEDIYDLSTVRMSFADPASARDELNDRAMRSVESATFPFDGASRAIRANREEQQAHLRSLLEADSSGELARRILVTGSPAYRRAFGKYVLGAERTNEERAALALGAGGTGGFAVVYTLDPTVLLTSNGTVNPMRAISSVESISGTNEWRGLTSAGVVATRRGEGVETTDAAPTLAQPALTVTKTDVFIPFSVELGQDWGQLQGQMARMIQDAKDDEEADSFVIGVGTTVFPQGVVVGATTTVAAGAGQTIVVADIYKLWEALPPRFRPRASWLANLFIYDKIRQFDTAGGASIFVPNLTQGFNNQGMGGAPADANLGYTLLMKAAYEASKMAAATTNGTKMLLVGDFSYYKIVDRTGMDIEVVPHLFGATNRYPTGQRGIYAYWRNFGKVLDVNAFRALTGTT